MTHLWQLGVAETTRLVRSKKVSPVEVLDALLARIDQVNPELNAWVVVDRQNARRAAQRQAVALALGNDPGPLAGVAVALKDIFHARGLPTECGSRSMAGFRPDHEATVVTRLRRHGAIILGKVQTCEFASVEPSTARNAWNSRHTPGGSSAGSGAAVGAGMVPLALGSQTGGSTLRPASFNGIVGLKATYGLLSCYGVVENSFSFDTVGIMVRGVEDAALALAATAAYDRRDSASIRAAQQDYAAAARPGRPPRLGLLRDYFLERCTPEIRAHTEQAADRLRAAGAQVEEVPLPAVFSRIHADHRAISGPELAGFHQAPFAEKESLYGRKLAARIREGLEAPGWAYVRAQRDRPAVIVEMERFAAPFDALLTPATVTPAPEDLNTTGDPSFQTPWSFCGFPSIAIPSGLAANGLPLGLQLVAPRRRDAHLLTTAAWCEQAVAFTARPASWG